MFAFENKEEFEAAVKSYLQENLSVHVAKRGGDSYYSSEWYEVTVQLGNETIFESSY